MKRVNKGKTKYEIRGNRNVFLHVCGWEECSISCSFVEIDQPMTKEER